MLTAQWAELRGVVLAFPASDTVHVGVDTQDDVGHASRVVEDFESVQAFEWRPPYFVREMIARRRDGTVHVSPRPTVMLMRKWCGWVRFVRLTASVMTMLMML